MTRHEIPMIPLKAGAALVGVAAAGLFVTEATVFVPRVTDVSAMRVAAGDVPYRDFWTMYAPGSFLLLGLIFDVVGRHLIVSNLLGALAAASGVAVFHRIASRVGPTWLAVGASAALTAAFYGTGYANGLTSFPSAFVLLMTAIALVVERLDADRAAAFWWPGLMLGLAVVFKHDVAAYAAAAVALGLVVARRGRGLAVAAPAMCFGTGVALPPVLVVAMLVALGAGPHMWRDLVVFPLTDFKYVRPEYFPILPRVGVSVIATIQSLVRWAGVTLPLAVLVLGAVGVRRHWSAVDDRSRFLVVVAGCAFVAHWLAAHVQINTHVISLVAWASLVALVGLRHAAWAVRPSAVGCVIVLSWVLVYPARAVYDTIEHWATPRQWVGLPGLAGIRAPAPDAEWMRRFSTALAQAGSDSAPLLFLSHRNDVHIFAALAPFWLTDRRPATRFHELHPGITDTTAGQSTLLADLAMGPLPIVVREHRFDDGALDAAKAVFIRTVPVGSVLVDDWLDQRYVAGPRFGNYELLGLR